jgi:multidrug efflux pump subunit AcrA (membrane-fusion protein)
MFFKNTKLLKEAKAELEILEIENAELKKRYANLIDVDKEIESKKAEIVNQNKTLAELDTTYIASLATFEALQKEIDLYTDSIDIGSYGLYEPQFSFDTSEKFKEAIEANYQKQKLAIKEDNAIICNTDWTVGGSKAEGKKMTTRNKKLMLYAFNGECDGLISKVKWNTANKIKERIEKAFNDINKLGEVQTTFITEHFKDLKLEELALTYEYEQKKYDEKEEQRQIREQMREEEKAQKELERAQKEAEDEEARFKKALDKARKELGSASQNELDELNNQISSLERKLLEAQERKERAISMAQMTKVGHIYVISNIGSFGEDVVKIGMTRRLDPLDRVRELGDASVPFRFDIHAIIYSENAPQLENELHKKFNDRRLNRINNRKEFFKASLEEIEVFVKEHAGAEIEFTKVAEAREYRETLIVNKTHLINENTTTKVFPKTLI